jgi:hypothetical protein
MSAAQIAWQLAERHHDGPAGDHLADAETNPADRPEPKTVGSAELADRSLIQHPWNRPHLG